MRLPRITNEKELAALVNEIGFLPFFRCNIPGFSLEECTPPGYWFADGVDGPWEWKGYVLDGTIAYGKLFRRRAGFVSRAWLPTLCNYRRDGYDFEGFYEDGLALYKSKTIVEELSRGACVSTELKKRCGYQKGGEKGFDGVITLLEMQTFVTIRAFEYARDRYGRPYGWGLARYALMESVFGEETVNAADGTPPKESFAQMAAHLSALWPETPRKQIELLLK